MSGNSNNNRNNNNKSANGKRKTIKESKQVATPDKESVSTDSLLNFISSASNAMRKALDMTKQGSSSSNSKKRDPNHRRHLIKNMKESSLEYSAYNKRRYKRRSTSCGSTHNGVESSTDSSEYLTDTMKALFMTSTENESVTNSGHLEAQNFCDNSTTGMDGIEQYDRDVTFFQENQWSADCESFVNTSQHYFNASEDLQLTGSYDNVMLSVPISAGYMPDPFDHGSNLTNSPSYLSSSIDFSESCSLSEPSSVFCSDSTASVGSCLYAQEKATGLPGPNGNMNNNVLAPEALASGEFSRVDTRLVEHVLAQSDIQATMNELVDIARPKRKRVSLTHTRDSFYPYSAPPVYPETPVVSQRHTSATTPLRPKSWTATRPAQHHKLVHNRQSCPPPVHNSNSPSCYHGSATGVSPYQGQFFSYWEPPGCGNIQTAL